MNKQQQSPGNSLLIIIGAVLIGFGVLMFIPAFFGQSAWSLIRYISRLVGPLFLIGVGIFVVYLASSGAFSRRTNQEGQIMDNQFQIPPQGTRLYRSTRERMIAGVCGGIAEYFNIDPTLVRIAAVFFLLWGAGFLAYIIAWVVIPPNPNE